MTPDEVLCRLAVKDARYAALAARLGPGGVPPPPPPPPPLPLYVRPRPRCIYEGPVVTYCVTCGPSVSPGRHVRDCGRFEICTLEPVNPAVHNCRGCPPEIYRADADPPPDVE